MMGPERTTKNYGIDRMTIVTSSPARHHSFSMLLPDIQVDRIDPHFTEELIDKPLNIRPAEWPMEMAQHKALQDLAVMYAIGSTNKTIEDGKIGETESLKGKHIRVYSDTITVSYKGNDPNEVPRSLEKPQDLISWFKDKENGAMALSGKTVQICTALTAFDVNNPLSHPVTILVRIDAKMRTYALEDVKKIIDNHGPQAILSTAGGISIWNGGTSLYDGTVPLRISIQSDAHQEPVPVSEIPDWQKLDGEKIKQILYGAVPESLEMLLAKIDWIADQKKLIDSIPVNVRQTRSTSIITSTPH